MDSSQNGVEKENRSDWARNFNTCPNPKCRSQRIGPNALNANGLEPNYCYDCSETF